MKTLDYDVIIVGAGPAGLTAGIYASRYGLKTLIIEKYYVGGQTLITTTVENFPGFDKISGQELSSRMLHQYEINGGALEYCKINKIDFEGKKIETKNKIFNFKSLILCLGSVPKKLNLENEETLTGRGVSYCAICDGPLYKNRNVAVIGDGDSAIENAVYLSTLAKKVYIVGKKPDLVCQDVLKEELQSKIEKYKNVEIYNNSVPTKINGTDYLESIEIVNTTNQDKKQLDVDGMFISIGMRPDSSIVNGILETDPAGFIITKNNFCTKCDYVFVAGDIRQKRLRQIVTACADGAECANLAFKYINKLEK